ncbi:hypothetical protein G9A89_023668 [Geosiphon pyriformis]|nr:hypothetical protein G9A89_023668 [Geosiphon pyriformis]
MTARLNLATMLRKKLRKPLEDTTTINLIESLSIIQRTPQQKPSDQTKPSDHYQLQLALSTKIWSDVKTKQLVSTHLCSASYKKPKKPTIMNNMVKILAGSLFLVNIVINGSKVNSETSSISSILNLENIKNTVAEETSYANSNTLKVYNAMNDATPKKICTRTYVMSSKPKTISFNNLSDNNNDILILPPVKFFVLDIELFAVLDKTNSNKLIVIKKIFYRIDGFGGTSIFSKFSRIIRSSFTSEFSLYKAKELAICEKIIINNDLRKVNNYSDQKVIVKEIPVDLSKSAIESVFSKFGKIVSIKMQLIGLWQKALVEFESSEIAGLVVAKWSVLMRKNSVCVAKAVNNKQLWVSRDLHQTLFYILPIGTMAHDLSDLLELYGRKTCFIGCNPSSYVYDRCAIVCFADEASKLTAIGSISVFKSVNLQWAGLSLACCTKYKQFGHISNMCSVGGNSSVCGKWMVTDQNWVYLAGIYKKKQAPIVRSVSFGNKTWAQVAGGFSSHVALLVLFSTGLFLVAETSIFASASPSDHGFYGYLVSLECSLELLANQVSGILKKLGSIELVFPVVTPVVFSLVVSVFVVSSLDINMVLDSVLVIDNTTTGLSLSSSKVLTIKVSGLESKIMALEVSYIGSLYFSMSVLVWKITMCNVRGINNPAKQDDIIHWHKEQNNLITVVTETKLKDKICPWIMNKFNGIWIFTSGLNSSYLGSGVVIIINVSLTKHVCKISKVPDWFISLKLLFKNKLSVSILGLYAGAFLVAWFSQAGNINSIIAKAINESSFVILGGDFNENSSHKCVSFKKCLNLGLVNSLSRCFYVKIPTWANSHGVAKTINFLFISLNLVNAVVGQNVFDIGEFFDTDHQTVSMSVGLGGLLNIWLNSFCKQVNKDCWKFDFKGADKAKWKDFGNATLANALMFSDEFAIAVRFLDLNGFNNVFTKESSRYYKLELLVSKIIKALYEENVAYCTSKLAKSLRAKKVTIRAAIDKKIESFEVNKSHIIRSVLEHPFHKVVLNHLVVDDELILEPDLVKSKVDIIMEGWTRKHYMYVFNKAFSNVMCSIEFDKLFGVIFSLLNGKAAGLSGILNELWKHCDRAVLDMFLVLLNSCLSGESTAHKILSKILSDRIFLACSTFDILHGNYFLVLKGCFGKESGTLNGFTEYKEGLRCIASSFVFSAVFTKVIPIVHDNLDQRKIFSPLLWHIFYDSLLCKIKRQESVCRYRLNSYFSATQHILDVAGEFFQINNISINNNKTVVIPINSRVDNPSLYINSSPISIAKKSEPYQYLGVFLLTEGFSKPSLAKANLDIHFFTNLILWKVVSDKQLLYLVLVVFHPIVSYRMQFSFVPDAFIHKDLKLKSGLPLDFPSDTIHNLFFYGLKPFFQVQSESKVASLVSFANSDSVNSVHLLSSPICIHVSASNNFLAGMIRVLLDYNLFLNFNVCCSGQHSIAFVNQLCDHYSAVFNWYTFKCWKKLDFYGSVPEWFKLSVAFLNSVSFFSTLLSVLHGVGLLNILESSNFVSVCDHLSQTGTSSLLVYMNGSLSNLGTASCRAGVAAYFEDIGLGLGVSMSGLMSSTLAELQAIALALEYVPSLSSIQLFSDNQSVLDACKLELGLACSDFCNQCWVEHCHIVNVIYGKNLRISWHKIKDYSGISENECTDTLAGAASLSDWYLPPCLDEHFLIANGGIVSGNFRHFVCDIYCSVCHTCWEISSGSKFLAGSLLLEVDWCCSLLVWHSDLNMTTSFTSKFSADACTYFIKALHHWLLVAVQKCLYNRLYFSVLCLYCDELEVLDHVFSCKIDESAWHHLLESHLLSSYISDFSVFMALYKGFVFDDWFCKVVSIFHNPKVASLEIVKFVCSLGLVFRTGVWSICAKHRAYMEKNGLIPIDGLAVISVPGLASRFSTGVVKLLGIADAVGVHFGFYKSLSVHIAV